MVNEQEFKNALNRVEALESLVRELMTNISVLRDTVNQSNIKMDILMRSLDELTKTVSDKDKTSDDFEIYSEGWIRKRVTERNLTFMPHHDCSFCRSPVGYVIDQSGIMFDSNCDCSSYRSPLRPSSYSELAQAFARQSTDDSRKSMAIWMKLIDE